jgi:hypothetical protein
MNRSILLTANSFPQISLRSAGVDDLDDLRHWKNANKSGFFFKKEITPEMQKEWFAAYGGRPDDYMFIVESQGIKAGCMAMRVEGKSIDVYNIIASPQGVGKGLMMSAMTMMCSFAAMRYTKDIGCLVLKDNPATSYYQRCHFLIVGDGGDHHIFKLDWTRFQPVELTVMEK